MKKAYMTGIVMLALPLICGFADGQEITEEQVVMSTAPCGSFETEQGKILKVFSAEQEGAIYRAYLVNWKGREVVVSDPLPGKAKKKTGDTITFMVNKVELDDPYGGKKKSKMLVFTVVPEMEKLPTQMNKVHSPPKTRQIGK